MVSVTRVDPADFSPSAFADPAGEGVAAQVRRVVDSATAADGRSPLNEAALLAVRHRGLEGSALYVAGSPVAGFAWVHEPGGTQDRADVNLVVAPESRGTGIATALAAAVEAPDGVTAWSHGGHPAAARLAVRYGLARVRDLWVMRRPLTDDLPEPWQVEGVAIRTFEPGRDEEAFLALNAEAFAAHPEQGGLTRAGLDERIAEPWFDPAGFFLAERDDRLVGFHWTKVHAADPPFGEVYVVGVAPGAQGGGLGRLLTLTGLRHLRERGLGEVILYVEADNAPAVAVYRRLGFGHDPADTDVLYERP